MLLLGKKRHQGKEVKRLINKVALGIFKILKSIIWLWDKIKMLNLLQNSQKTLEAQIIKVKKKSKK